MFEQYFKDKVGPLTLRLAIGAVCIHHGFLKIMIEGGTNWAPGVPTSWQAFLSWGEFVAGLMILAGFWTRLGALLSVAVTVCGVAWTFGWKTFEQPIRVLEPSYVFLLISATLLFLGGGEWTLTQAGSKGAGRSPRPTKLAA